VLLRAHGVRTLDDGDAAGSEGRGGIAEGACGGGLTQMASAVVEAAPVTVAPSLLWLTGQQVDAALLMTADDC